MKVILTLWTLNYVDFLFSSKKESCQLCQLTLKNLDLKPPKNMIKPPLSNLFDFIGWLPNYNCVWSNVSVAFPKYTTKIYRKVTIHVNQLILTPFSSFDIKGRILNLMWKTSGISFFKASRSVSFPYFPKVALDIV